MNQKRWMWVGIAAVAAALLGGAAVAQRGPLCPWAPVAPNVDTLQQQFGLTMEQAQKVADLQKGAQERLSQPSTEMWAKQQEFATLWKATEIDEKAIRAKLQEVERARADMLAAQLDYQLALRKALPADQWAQLAPGCGMGCGYGLGPGPGGGRGAGAGRGRGAGRGLGRGMGRGLGWGAGNGTGPCAGTPFCPWVQPAQ